MDHLFLDANVLFSAAYRQGADLLRFWNLKNVILCSSHYALEEARINLSDDAQRGRLARLARKIQLFDSTAHQLPRCLLARKRSADIACRDGRADNTSHHRRPSALWAVFREENRRDSDCNTIAVSENSPAALTNHCDRGWIYRICRRA